MSDNNNTTTTSNVIPMPMQARFKPFDDGIRSALEEYRDRNNLSLSDLARQLASSTTIVSKYINGKPEGDVFRLESIIRDVLANETKRRQAKNTLFPTVVTRKAFTLLETIRETNDVGLISGPAGVGKTSAIQLYAAANPSSISLTATTWTRSCAGIEHLLFAALSTPRLNKHIRRAQHIADTLASSNRLLIIDNAHKLQPSALSWLFDLHDHTSIPIALIGNPEILRTISANDQHHSRIGIHVQLSLAPGQAKSIASKIIEQLLPEAAGQIDELCETIAEHQGTLRALRKQLLLAKKLRENNTTIPDWTVALKSAHAHLLRDYALA
jgi:DNA transposition AAA+ family ATPase